LRVELETMAKKNNAQLFYARPEYCTDNGAMIALAGARRLDAGQCESLAIDVHPRWPLTDLAPL
jgi:N6-L-threonylcarbamoyladenine synthase